MAQDNIFFNQSTQYGSLLRLALKNHEDGFIALNNVLSVMGHMITGSGTSDTEFAEVTTRFGFDDNADAKAAWDELNSYLAKVNTDASVSNVNAAMLQLFSKMR